MVMIFSYLLAYASQIARYPENEHRASVRFRRRQLSAPAGYRAMRASSALGSG